ncbi:MAG: hypothetical protein QNJ51_14210 [Calothrix sp. MO_167.B12]|nr:hypothetical protein [Calothrix sp. MO_167.B12]
MNQRRLLTGYAVAIMSLGLTLVPVSPGNVMAEDVFNYPKVNPKEIETSFNQLIAGPYIVTLDPKVGPQEIVTFFADGNARRTVSLQFSSGAGDNGFSDSQGVWRRVGSRRIRATFFNINFSTDDGAFVGMARVNYDVIFNYNLRKIEGSFAGQVFAAGVNPANPGDAKPIAEFSGKFTGKRANVQRQPMP